MTESAIVSGHSGVDLEDLVDMSQPIRPIEEGTPKKRSDDNKRDMREIACDPVETNCGSDTDVTRDTKRQKCDDTVTPTPRHHVPNVKSTGGMSQTPMDTNAVKVHEVSLERHGSVGTVQTNPDNGGTDDTRDTKRQKCGDTVSPTPHHNVPNVKGPGGTSRASRGINAVRVREVLLERHVSVGAVQTNPDNGRRTLSLNQFKSNAPLLVQFDGGGYVDNKFGVTISEKTGRTVLTISIGNENEYNAIRKLQDELTDYAVSEYNSGRTWWPKDPEIGPMHIKCNFTTMTKLGARKDGSTEPVSGAPRVFADHWSPKFRLDVPVSKKGALMATVKNEYGEKIDDIYSIRGKKWTTAIVELGQVYFSATSTWGIGPKRLRYLEVVQNRYDPYNTDYGSLVVKPS